MKLSVVAIKKTILLRKLFRCLEVEGGLFFLEKVLDLNMFYPLQPQAQHITNKFLIKAVLKRRLKTFKKPFNTLKYILLYQFFNKFIFNFLEFFLKSKILFNLKKSSGGKRLRRLTSKRLLKKYFRRNIKVGLEIFGVLYYSFLLKDSTFFANFFRKLFERIRLKLHKKVLIGLRKLLKRFFTMYHKQFGLLGLFLNVKGKLSVTGNAKKRRYFFYFGRHNITKRTLRIDLKHLPI